MGINTYTLCNKRPLLKYNKRKHRQQQTTKRLNPTERRRNAIKNPPDNILVN